MAFSLANDGEVMAVCTQWQAISLRHVAMVIQIGDPEASLVITVLICFSFALSTNPAKSSRREVEDNSSTQLRTVMRPSCACASSANEPASPVRVLVVPGGITRSDDFESLLDQSFTTLLQVAASAGVFSRSLRFPSRRAATGQLCGRLLRLPPRFTFFGLLCPA